MTSLENIKEFIKDEEAYISKSKLDSLRVVEAAAIFI